MTQAMTQYAIPAMTQYAIPVERDGVSGYDIYDSTGYLAYSCVSYRTAKAVGARQWAPRWRLGDELSEPNHKSGLRPRS